MRKKISLCCICLGIVCILGAAGILGYTQIEEKNAASFSQTVTTVFGEELQKTYTTEGETEQLLTKSIAINGAEYMGVLLIPQLELELPVASTYTEALLQQTPCVFAGEIETEDIIIAAHNYEVHFGKISQLEVNDEIFLVDVAGKMHQYQLVLEETLDGDDLADLYAGEWDLTLFTCSHLNNAKRAVLRFEEMEKDTAEL